MKTCKRCDEPLKTQGKYCGDCLEMNELEKSKAQEQKARRQVARD